MEASNNSISCFVSTEPRPLIAFPVRPVNIMLLQSYVITLGVVVVGGASPGFIVKLYNISVVVLPIFRKKCSFSLKSVCKLNIKALNNSPIATRACS